MLRSPPSYCKKVNVGNFSFTNWIVFHSLLCLVRCLGTEDRVTDPTKVVGVSTTVTPFVTFPGNEIKDLYVHDGSAAEPAAAPTPAPAAPAAPAAAKLPTPPTTGSTSAPPKAPTTVKGNRNDKKTDPSTKQQTAPPQQQARPVASSAPISSAGATTGPATSAGTGEHLLKMRVKKSDEVTAAAGSTQGSSIYS